MVLAIEVPFTGADLTVSGVLWAAVAVLATWLVARYAGRAVMRIGRDVNGGQEDFALRAARLVRYLIVILGAGVVLACLGAPIEPVLAAVLIVGLAGLLMARGVADNFGAGLVMQARHTLTLGDLIETNGHTGHVTDLNSRSVIVETFDGKRVHLPNKQLMDAPLVIASARGRNRAELQVRVSLTGSDTPTSVANEIERTVSAVRGVLGSPAPQALLAAAEPGRATFLVQLWHEPGVAQQVCSRSVTHLHATFSNQGRESAVLWPPPNPPLTPPAQI